MSSSPDPQEIKRQIRDRIRAPKADELVDRPDPQSKKELAVLKHAKVKVEIEVAWQDLYARKKYASYAFWLVAGWMIFIAITVILQGFHLLGFNLDYKIILALIGGTTTSTVGIFLVVARYLFYRHTPVPERIRHR